LREVNVYDISYKRCNNKCEDSQVKVKSICSIEKVRFRIGGGGCTGLSMKLVKNSLEKAMSV